MVPNCPRTVFGLRQCQWGIALVLFPPACRIITGGFTSNLVILGLVRMLIPLCSTSSVGASSSQVPPGRMIIFGNGWVPLGHLTMYWQECHNAQHTRGYIESRKSNFSMYDNPGIYWSQKIYIYLWQIFCIRSNLDLLINVIVQCYAYLWILTSSNTSVYRLQIKEYEKV